MIGPTSLSAPAASADGNSRHEARELAKRLLGARVSSTSLRSFLGESANPQIIRTNPCAVYFYPGGTSPTEAPPWKRDDSAQHRGFHEHEGVLASYGATTVGISSEPLSLQLGLCSELELRHLLFSDPTFEIAEALGLPTFLCSEHRFYERLALITNRGGRIEKVFYPVQAAQNAAQVGTWLQMHGAMP